MADSMPSAEELMDGKISFLIHHLERTPNKYRGQKSIEVLTDLTGYKAKDLMPIVEEMKKRGLVRVSKDGKTVLVQLIRNT